MHGQIQLRQKNSSQTGMHSNPMSTLQHRENFISTQTPQANLQGYHSHAATIDHDANSSGLRSNAITNPHRRGGSNQFDLGRTPQKSQQPGGVSLKYANQQYGKSGDLAAQRAGARSQIGNATNPQTSQKAGSLVSQSLDPVKLSMAKRKASNDDSRFKNIRDRYHVGNGGHLPNTQNLMAPFLDQSLDAASGNNHN